MSQPESMMFRAARWMTFGSAVSILCVYDRRTVPAEALAAAAQTHPHLHTGSGRQVMTTTGAESSRWSR